MSLYFQYVTKKDMATVDLFAIGNALIDQEFKRIAMRSCKTDTSFEAMIQLCASLINSR